MAATSTLETKLNEVFVGKAPALPPNGKKALVKYLPIISLVVGLLTLYSAWVLWHWAHLASSIVNYANQLSQVYGGNAIATSRFGVGVWLGIAVLAVEAVLYLLAYPGLRDHKKQGWNYLYYGALVNVAYAVVTLFTGYDAVGHFIGALVGSAIGFYFLFQLRASYLGSKSADVKPEA